MGAGRCRARSIGSSQSIWEGVEHGRRLPRARRIVSQEDKGRDYIGVKARVRIVCTAENGLTSTEQS